MLSSYFLLILAAIVAIFQIEKLFPESFKARPKIILGLLIVFTVASFIDDHYKHVITIKNDHDRDSLAEVKRKESIQSILDGFGNAIGKFGLKYDSAKQELVALIKDSAGRKITIIEGENPHIDFDFDTGIVMNSFTNDSIKLAVTVRSYAALAILKTATLYWIYGYDQGNNVLEMKYDTSMDFLIKKSGIPKDGSGSQVMTVSRNNKKRPFEFIILIKGTYTNSNGKNPQPLDIVGSYYLDSKAFFLVSPPYDDSVRIFLKRKGMIKKL